MGHAGRSADARSLGRLLVALDLAGSFVFAVERASAAISARLDLLGVLALAFATALCGGIGRDVLIGAAPPQALRDWRYATVAFAGGAVTIGGVGCLAIRMLAIR